MVAKHISWIGAAALASCSTAQAPLQTAAALPLPCAAFRESAEFSCWWSAKDAPLTHCVLRSETNPTCRLGQKGGAYLTRGAALERESNRSSGWVGVKVFEDQSGHVGFRTEGSNGQEALSHSSASPVPTGAPTPPSWPRFPEGLEFGPEQVRSRTGQ